VAKTLVVAEKPSVARDIVNALPGPFQAPKDSYWESDDTIVTFAVGHLVGLKDPEAYDEKFKRWRMDDLPILPGKFELEPRDAKSKKQLKEIHNLMQREDVDRIVNACDAGREGELIFSYIYELAGIDKPVQRLWISSMTKQAIQDGFQRLRPGTEMTSLEEAARSRSEADWLVGMNATRAATLRGRAWVGGVVSLGRVQTPTLAMIVKREREIQAFTPEPYWLVHATFDPRYAGLWFEGDETRIFGDPERAPAIAAKVTGKDGIVESVERKEQREVAPLLYDLTSLQRDANRRFGFSARRTLQAAQSLYEGKKAITYPRTSSRYLSGDMVPQLKPTAGTLLGIKDYEAGARFVLDLDELPLKRVVNDARVSDHHAIIPTDIEHDINGFSPDERRVFDLVAKRFLAVFHPPARYQRTTVITVVEEERFRTRGKITLEAGWRGVYGLESEEEKIARQEEEGPDESTAEIPPLEQGQKVRCVEAEVEAKETRPPPRYTEATLLSAMETAGKLIDDEELREAMKESGLGTPATRAEMIEALIRREYIERVGKDLQPTPKGLQVITMLEEHKITSPELTGDWEHRLSEIEHGDADRGAFMSDVAGFTDEIVKQIAALDKEKLRPVRVELGSCPRCGAETGEIIKENSRAYGCTSWKSREETGCGFVIWKKVAGRTLTPEIARQLLEEGKTREVLSGFKSRAGKHFRARLVLTPEGKVEFDFPARPTREGDSAETDEQQQAGEQAAAPEAAAAE
jgi:DNA topoisomerase-3